MQLIVCLFACQPKQPAAVPVVEDCREGGMGSHSTFVQLERPFFVPSAGPRRGASEVDAVEVKPRLLVEEKPRNENLPLGPCLIHGDGARAQWTVDESHFYWQVVQVEGSCLELQVTSLQTRMGRFQAPVMFHWQDGRTILTMFPEVPKTLKNTHTHTCARPF